MSNCVKGSGVESSFCGAVNEKKNMMNSELNKNNHLPIAIIGAGPVGLAAAAHLADKQQNFIVLESGSRVGHNILEWAHVRLFSPWQYNIDKIARKLLKESGWMEPQAEELPTGKELVENYLEPLASLPQIKKNLQLNAKVLSVSKKSLDKMKNSGREQSSFVIYVEQQDVTERIEAKAVIDATGTWAQPNPVNADNIWTTEERELEDRIFYGIPNVSGKQRKRYIGKKLQ